MKDYYSLTDEEKTEIFDKFNGYVRHVQDVKLPVLGYSPEKGVAQRVRTLKLRKNWSAGDYKFVDTVFFPIVKKNIYYAKKHKGKKEASQYIVSLRRFGVYPEELMEEVKNWLKEQEDYLVEVAQFYASRVQFYLTQNRAYIESLKISDVDFLQGNLIQKQIDLNEDGGSEAKRTAQRENEHLRIEPIISALRVQQTGDTYSVNFPHLRYYPDTKIPFDELFKILDLGFLDRNIRALGITYKALNDTDEYHKTLLEKWSE